MRAIEWAQNFLDLSWIGGCALRFNRRSPIWLDCERYLHRQRPYGMQYCLHEIFSIGNVTELSGGYPTSTKSLKSVLNWWLCTEIHIPPPKVVGLWEISSPPASIRHAVLHTWNNLYGQRYKAEWGLPNEHKISKIGFELVIAHWDSYHASQSGWTMRDIFTASDHTAYSTDDNQSHCGEAAGQLPIISVALRGWSCWRITDRCTKEVD